MQAMILAAGIGSRLKPLTDKTPKALIEVGGKTMLEIVIERLKIAGVTEIIINTHHLPEQIEEFLLKNKKFNIRIKTSHEMELLDTGGGLKKAAKFFSTDKPFILHNVDILSGIDLTAMLSDHEQSGALATLAVQKRDSGRYLLFDSGQLCGWTNAKEDRIKWAKSEIAGAERLAFCGVHVISPPLLEKMAESGVFSINKTYLRLAGLGENIRAFRSDDFYWADIGDSAKLKAARSFVKMNGLPN